MDPKVSDRKELLKSALVRIDQLEKKLAAADARQHAPVAIIGIGCRFPGGANDPSAFWELLRSGTDAITDIPPQRWNVDAVYDPNPDAPGRMYARGGGFIDDIDRFDPQFFGIAPREAPYMDPQQRLLLETAWAALEHAGVAPGGLVGSATGVFIGLTTSDYARLQSAGQSGFDYIDTYFGTGAAASIAAGRLSYVLGLRGPAITLDTACSSSLVAIHLACQSVRAGESRMALAGGCNLILSPEGHVIASKGRMLAPDSRCKTFDARADGYVRSEGCGILVLKRLADAIADDDPVLAVIRGTASNQDGRSGGLTAPSGRAQEDVLRQALADANLAPHDVAYVEAHGTGTSLGDPIEVLALGAIQAGRPPEAPLLIGSVKTNIGHLEAAAGVAGVIKAALSLHHQEIPPHLHFETPNPLIPWTDLPIRVASQRQPWPDGRPRVVGVSSFGFSGTNVHVLLEAAPEREVRSEAPDAPRLLLISAKTPAALASAAARMSEAVAGASNQALEDVCYTAAAGRSHFEHRLAIVAASTAEFQDGLRAFQPGEAAPGLVHGEAPTSRNVDVAFLFTGQGSQYCGMGHELYVHEPVFRAALDRCADVLMPSLGMRLTDVLYPAAGGENEAEALLAQTRFTQPALFAVEYALAELWRAWGVVPSVVMGHSVGEYVAAVVAGALDLESGLLLIAERGRLMQNLEAGGAMVAVAAPEHEVLAALKPFADQVAIAAVNGPGQTVISGTAAGVTGLLTALGIAGEAARPLKVSHAFHSPLLEPMLDEFERYAAGFSYRAPATPLISNVTGAAIDRIDAAYWRRHARSTVRYSDSLDAIVQSGIGVFLEVGPHPALTGLGRRTLTAPELRWAASLRRGDGGRRQMLTAAAELHIAGVRLDWRSMYASRPARRTRIPTYPFARERFWIEPRAPRPQLPDHGHPLLGRRVSSPRLSGHLFESELGPDHLSAIRDHRIWGRVIFPASAYLEIAAAAAHAVFGSDEYMVENLAIRAPLVFEDEGARRLQVFVGLESDGVASFEVFSQPGGADTSADWTTHAAGQVRRGRVPAAAASGPEPRGAAQDDREAGEYYSALAAAGVEYGPSYRAITRIAQGEAWASADLEVPPLIAGELDQYHVHPAILDACFQTIGLAVSRADQAAPSTDIYLPVEAARFSRFGRLQPSMRVEARAEGAPTAGTLSGSIRLLGSDNTVIAVVDGLRFRRAKPGLVRRPDDSSLDGAFCEIDWRLSETPPVVAPAGGRWLLLADGAGVADGIRRRLVATGSSCVYVTAGDSFSVEGDEWSIRRGVAADYVAVWRTLRAGGDVAGVVHCLNAELDVRGAMNHLDCDHVRAIGTTSVLHLVQAMLAGAGAAAPLTIVTVQGQPAGGTDVSPGQSAVWGLGRTIATEHPELQLRLIDVSRELATNGDEQARLVDELRVADRSERDTAIRPHGRFVARLVRSNDRQKEQRALLAVPEAPAFGLTIRQRGVLDHLELEPVPIDEPGPGDIRIRVHASGLNFRDVLNALGMYPGDPGQLGGEAVGVVEAVGAGVTRFGVGDPVLALTPRGFCSVVVTSEKLACRRPEWLSVEAAATIPIVFQTAQYALRHVAGLRAGERVLIHAGAGGVGLAAIQIAQLAGAEIFATAGSPRKREMLRELGVRHVFDSRTLDFADEIRRVTRGEGIDVVLNSLAGEFIERSLSLLRSGGRFIELGKTDLWSDERARAVNAKASYHVVYLGDVCITDPDLIATMFADLMAGFEAGRLKPLPRRVWPIDRANDAFRYMAQARHVGKIVIDQATAAEREDVRPNSSYLVTGAFKGLGLATASWLARRGAAHLTLVGRSKPDENAEAVLREIEEGGTSIAVAVGDVADPAVLGPLVAAVTASGAPLRGVVHAAGVIDDVSVRELDASRLAGVMRPKVDGAYLLHTLTQRHDLDFFVMYSAGAALFGAPGQANYAAANAFMDGLAWHRRDLGLPACSINWGPWKDVGMAARLTGRERDRWDARGIRALSVDQGLAALGRSLRSESAQVAVLPIDWPVFLGQWPQDGTPALLRALAAEAAPARPAQTATAARVPLVQVLAQLPPEDRLAAIQSHVIEQVAQVLALPASSVRKDRGFADLGMDSLMSVELSNRLTKMVQRPLPATIVFEHPTVESLTAFVAATLGVEPAAAAAESEPVQTVRDALIEEVESLSEAEAAESLARELDRAGY